MQAEQKVDKTVALKIAYLLGVEEHVLGRDYEVPYQASKQLELFKNYEDANKLRSLSRLRQSVMRYNSLYKGVSSVVSATNGHLEPDITYLQSEGIDIENIYGTHDVITYLNILSEMISVIVFKVLVDLDVPRPEILQEYFKFPAFNKKAFEKFLTEYKTLSCPHGIILYKGAKIRQSLSFALTNDNNIFYSIYSIRGERYDKAVKDTDSYIWRTEKGDNLDEQAVINVSDVVQKVKVADGVENLENKSIAVVENIEPVAPLVIPHFTVNGPFMPKTSVMNVGNVVESFIHKGETEVYVDCDNMDFFKFMNFIVAIEDFETIKGVKLIADMKASFLWKVFTELYKGKINVEVITVKRLKEQKSVADIVLTSKICESVYKNNLKRVILMSSDSDFYGLIQTLKADVDFCICYTDMCTNEDYLRYLNNENIASCSLTLMDTLEMVNTYKDICIEYLLAYSLALTPMYKWDLATLVNNVVFHFNKETELELESTYVETKVTELMQNVTVKADTTNTILKINKVELNASQLFLRD